MLYYYYIHLDRGECTLYFVILVFCTFVMLIFCISSLLSSLPNYSYYQQSPIVVLHPELPSAEHTFPDYP